MILLLGGGHTKFTDVVKLQLQILKVTLRLERNAVGNKSEQIAELQVFTIHDGTGGIAVMADSFSTQEFGDHLIQWECRHDMRMKGLFTNIMLSGDIRRHRWTLWD